MTTIAEAADIMGSHFFGLEEAIALHRLDATSSLIPPVFDDIPYPVEALEKNARDYLLIPVLPLSMGALIAAHFDYFSNNVTSAEALNTQPNRVGWTMVAMRSLNRGRGQSYTAQTKVLRRHDAVADASTLSQAFLLGAGQATLWINNRYLTSTTEIRSGVTRRVTAVPLEYDRLAFSTVVEESPSRHSGLALILTP